MWRAVRSTMMSHERVRLGRYMWPNMGPCLYVHCWGPELESLVHGIPIHIVVLVWLGHGRRYTSIQVTWLNMAWGDQNSNRTRVLQVSIQYSTVQYSVWWRKRYTNGLIGCNNGNVFWSQNVHHTLKSIQRCQSPSLKHMIVEDSTDQFQCVWSSEIDCEEEQLDSAES